MYDEDKYDGNIITTEKDEPAVKFNWNSLFAWLFTFLVLLMPCYLLVLLHYSAETEEAVDVFLFRCFVIEDLLWVFATVLLFVLINFYRQNLKNRSTKDSLKLMIGLLCFITVELTWGCFKTRMSIEQPQIWAIWLSAILCLVSLIIATILQVEYIKKGE